MVKLEEKQLMKDPFLRRFLSDDENYQLFQNYQQNPSLETAKELDYKFRKELTKARAMAYLSKVIRRKAIEFDKDDRNYRSRFTTTLDQPTEEGDGHTNKDDIESTIDLSNRVETRIEDIINTNPSLGSAIGSLTSRQRKILFLSFVEGFTGKEIAEKLGSSPQAVSKSKKKALDTLRREINGRDDVC